MAKYSANVVIVGAGVAGVTAAAWLTNNGIDDVLVLEAQDYIGGRVKGEVVDGKNIDLGAQFVHGWDGNPAYEIAHKLGRVAFPDEDYQGTQLQNTPKEFLTSKGEKIPLEKVAHVLQFLNDEIDLLFNEPLTDDGTSEAEFFDKVYKKFRDLYSESSSPDDLELYDAVFSSIYDGLAMSAEEEKVDFHGKYGKLRATDPDLQDDPESAERTTLDNLGRTEE